MGLLMFWVGVHLSYGSSELPGVPPNYTPAAQWGAKKTLASSFLFPSPLLHFFPSLEKQAGLLDKEGAMELQWALGAPWACPAAWV